MKDYKNVIIGLVAVVAIIFGVSYLKPPSITVQVPKAETASPALGALAGPDIPYNWFSFGGVRRFAARSGLNQASTTICALQSPAATSTLVSSSVSFTTGTTTAYIGQFGKSVSPSATTTNLGQFMINDGGLITALASTSPTEFPGGTGYAGVLNNDWTSTFSPNQYLVVKYSGPNNTGTAAKNAFVGTCNAIWEQNSGY